MKTGIDLNMEPFKPFKKGLPVIDLDCNTLDLLNGSEAKLLETLEKLSLGKLVSKRNQDLNQELKEKIIEYLEVPINLAGENIVFGWGSYSIMERLAWKFLPKGLMIGPFPQFRYFPMEYILAGGNYKGLCGENFSLPFEQIIRNIKRNNNLKIIYIDNPNNPTGKVYDKSQLLQIIEVAQKKKIIVILDEVYGDLLPKRLSFARYINKFDNLIILRSFSKIFGLQDLRVGYMIANKYIILKYQRICNWNEITNFGSAIAITLLNNQESLKKAKGEVLNSKKSMIQFLRGKCFKVVEGDMRVPLIFFRSKKQIDLGEYFRKMNIKVEGSSSYKVLVNEFPSSYARIRVSISQNDFELLSKRL